MTSKETLNLIIRPFFVLIFDNLPAVRTSLDFLVSLSKRNCQYQHDKTIIYITKDVLFIFQLSVCLDESHKFFEGQFCECITYIKMSIAIFQFPNFSDIKSKEEFQHAFTGYCFHNDEQNLNIHICFDACIIVDLERSLRTCDFSTQTALTSSVIRPSNTIINQQRHHILGTGSVRILRLLLL